MNYVHICMLLCVADSLSNILQWPPYPGILVFVYLSPLEWARLTDSLLINKMLDYKRTVASIWGTHSPTESDAMLWAALWSCPNAKELRLFSSQQPARNWSTQSSNLQGTESCHQLTACISLEADPSLGEPSYETTVQPTAWLQPPKKPIARGMHLSHTHILNPQKLRNVCIFKLLRYSVICCAVV